jgi:catechol 2,3-dioxygenase-like lactoylglutathione lyase family enzyme
MFSHLTIGTNDLARAIAFYDAILAPLGIERARGKFPGWASWNRPGEAVKLWVGRPYNQLPASWGNGWMAAFTAPTRAAVNAAYAAAMAAGAYDEGAPGLRPHFAALMFAILTETNCISSAAPKVESIGRRR